MRFAFVLAAVIWACVPAVADARAGSAFYPTKLIERIRSNAERGDWGRTIKERAVELAEPWRAMSDEQLWKLMFGATIPRSWMVWSNGHCPACEKPVPMYDWQIDAIDRPWKVRCPHCQELFPKNDFARFYESGLDEQGIFDPARADRALLFNLEHPNADDPKRTFGVDDGNGYVDGEKRWRFISTYLVFGQWKQAVHLGITRLATAYVVSSDPAYARKAAILLDRVADVYPTFDFKSQGLLYESVQADGYVSVWHDATIETREMALAYDAIKSSVSQQMAAKIEQRILRDALANQHKIYSNFPQQQLTVAVIDTVLGWPGNREQVLAALDPVIAQSTAIDGTTGEKGLANYSAYAAQRLAEFLGYYARMDEQFLPEMIRRHPRLPEMYRFFIDTWCADGSYYPLVGDTGWFAAPQKAYAGVAFDQHHFLAPREASRSHSTGVLTPSAYTLLWRLYEHTNDPAFAQVVWRANEAKADGLPYDITWQNPAAMQKALAEVITKHGAALQLRSVNKEQWRLAILRSGEGASERAAWISYDAGGAHGHRNGMNLGLFAHGLDLMPDFGYPPVQFGGWESPRANWYKSTLAHNTVIIDGKEQDFGAVGETTHWLPHENGFSAITVSGAAMYAGAGAKVYQRTIAMIDTSERDSYVLDVFRVEGGSEHAKFFLSHFGPATTTLPMQTATDFKHPQMRNWRVARRAPAGWSVLWKIDDRYKLLPPEQASELRLRYTDFTAGCDAYLGEAWVVAGSYNSSDEAWVPRVMVRRRGQDLKSTFVSLIEPYRGTPLIKKATRLATDNDDLVKLQVELSSGRVDLLEASSDGKVTHTVTRP